MFKLHQPGSTLYFKSIKSFDKYMTNYNQDIKIDSIQYAKLKESIKKHGEYFIKINMRYIDYNNNNKLEYWKEVEHTIKSFQLL